MAEDPTTRSGTGGGVDHEADGQPERETGRRPSTSREATAEPVPLSQHVGRIVLVVIAVLFVVFAVVNSQRVTFDWVFGQTEVVEQGGEYVSGGIPLIVLLIGSFVLGGIVGAGLLWRQRRVRRARRGSEDRPDG